MFPAPALWGDKNKDLTSSSAGQRRLCPPFLGQPEVTRVPPPLGLFHGLPPFQEAQGRISTGLLSLKKDWHAGQSWFYPFSGCEWDLRLHLVIFIPGRRLLRRCNYLEEQVVKSIYFSGKNFPSYILRASSSGRLLKSVRHNWKRKGMEATLMPWTIFGNF